MGVSYPPQSHMHNTLLKQEVISSTIWSIDLGTNLTLTYKHKAKGVLTHIECNVDPLAMVVIKELHDIQEKEECLTQLAPCVVSLVPVPLSNGDG